MTYLYGVVQNCFNSFYAFRGYAKPKDIVRYSEAYNGYQRDLNVEHVEEIVQYLRDGINVFSPEIILAYTVDDWWQEDINPSFHGEGWCGGGVSPVDYLVNNNAVSKHARVTLRDYDGIKVSKLSTNLGNEVHLVRISLPDDLPHRPFRRIDGNHRLVAMSEIEGERAEYQIPICIVFLKADFFEGQTDNGIDTAKTEMTIFHNINSKAKALTPEESLRGIIENVKMFSDNELRSRFGLHYYLTRELLKEVKLEHYPNIFACVSSVRYSFFMDLFDCLIKDIPNFAEDAPTRVLLLKFSDIEMALSETAQCSAHGNVAIIGAMAYYKLAAPDKFVHFLKWIKKNHIEDAKNVHINDVIGIYDKVYENTPKRVFLARWYPEETDSEHQSAEYRFCAIRNAVKSYTPQLELIDMGSRVAGTFSIREAINLELPTSDIFIADLTGLRPNVMIEVGMALKNLPDGRMLFYFKPTNDADKVPFDLSGYQFFPISEAYDIDNKVVPALRNVLDSIKNGA
jgi:hypothetical protein